MVFQVIEAIVDRCSRQHKHFCPHTCTNDLIHQTQVAVLARRLTGKYIAPESKHLTKRVEEIEKGEYEQLIEQVMQKPIEELKELYNHRDIEK